MTPRAVFTIICISLSAAGQAGAQDIAAGEALYQSVCRNCHGPKAQGLASYPKLSDKDATFLQIRLEQYRAGERIGPNSPLMIPHARDLTDDDIANLTGYITTAFQ